MSWAFLLHGLGFRHAFSALDSIRDFFCVCVLQADDRAMTQLQSFVDYWSAMDDDSEGDICHPIVVRSSAPEEN
jgi:hypothetical protein